MRHQNRDPGALKKARGLRRDQTEGERILWEGLRRKALGYTFRRQFPLGPYVLDFYCARARLCVEVDGEQHAFCSKRDAARDAYLLGLGILTDRVASVEVFANLEGVLDSIARLCQQRR